MEEFGDLELLSLVTKVAESCSNFGFPHDKVMAEFIIDTHGESKTFQDFAEKMQNMGASFSPSLLENIDRLILSLHPKHKKAAAMEQEDRADDVDKKARLFKGLAIEDKPIQFEDEPEDASGAALDDTFDMLAGLGPTSKGPGKMEPVRRKESPPYQSRGEEQNRRKRRRSRSRSPRQSHNDEYIFQDEFGRTRTVRRDEQDRGARRRRRDSDDDDQFRRPPTPEIDDEPVLYKVYDGTISKIMHFGVFVKVKGVRGKRDGLVHISQIQEGYIDADQLRQLVSEGQPVKVKAIKIEGGKLSLSMKEVDQQTGRDLRPHQRIASGANMLGLRGENDEPAPGPRMNWKEKKKVTDQERWEIKQLVASGVLPRSALVEEDEDYKAALRGEAAFEEEEEVDIEVREEEPPFLAGQTKQSLQLSPIRIVKNPEGSMNRAAMKSGELAKERRELKQAEADAKAAEQAQRVDLSSQWNDPLSTQKQFASDIRSARNNQASSNQAVPTWKKIAQHSRDQSFGKRTTLSMKEQRESLPVFALRDKFLEAVSSNQILIVVGETGSGKTTQLTQYLAEAGYNQNGAIGCTQPRRIAAMSVAKRVAEEVGVQLGNEVGYSVRFDDKSSNATKILYMTDGILQRQLLLDPNCTRYDVIMLDEAHERTIATDVLFSLLKNTLKRRPDMKLIVTSATLDAEKFSKYFLDAPVFYIQGRTFPVENLHVKEPEPDYLEAALNTVLDIHLTEEPGDILVFLTGKEEIDSACETLSERCSSLGKNIPELVILPIYGALPSEIASQVFEPSPPGVRKCVIATNIAETSLTLDGVKFVVDPGFVKESSYDASLGMDRLEVVPISQAQARQRSGRAGRTQPGKTFRLYTENAYQNEMLPNSIPEIQRQNLANTLLMLKAMGINDLLHFDFMDPPAPNSMLAALEELYCLGALDDEGLLTRMGRRMADFPLSPALAKFLINSVELKCSAESLIIVAMISGTQSVFYRPRDKQQQADAARARLSVGSDHLTLLNVYRSWEKSGCSPTWATQHYLQQKHLVRVRDVVSQLQDLFKRHKHPIVSCGADTERVIRSLCAGFFRNSARKGKDGEYATLTDNTPVHLHPSSAVFGRPPEYILYNSLVETTRSYAHVVSAIDARFLPEAAPKFFRVAPTDRLSKRKKAERIQPLQSKFAGEDDWRLSAQKKSGRGGGGTWG